MSDTSSKFRPLKAVGTVVADAAAFPLQVAQIAAYWLFGAGGPAISQQDAVLIYDQANGRYREGLGLTEYEFEAAAYVIGAGHSARRALEMLDADARDPSADLSEKTYCAIRDVLAHWSRRPQYGNPLLAAA